jgi:hypothetical protein
LRWCGFRERVFVGRGAVVIIHTSRCIDTKLLKPFSSMWFLWNALICRPLRIPQDARRMMYVVERAPLQNFWKHGVVCLLLRSFCKQEHSSERRDPGAVSNEHLLSFEMISPSSDEEKILNQAASSTALNAAFSDDASDLAAEAPIMRYVDNFVGVVANFPERF